MAAESLLYSLLSRGIGKSDIDPEFSYSAPHLTLKPFPTTTNPRLPCEPIRYTFWKRARWRMSAAAVHQCPNEAVFHFDAVV